MLVACRLAGLSALEGHYASLMAFAQYAHAARADRLAAHIPSADVRLDRKRLAVARLSRL
jgi:hypothetical protein